MLKFKFLSIFCFLLLFSCQNKSKDKFTDTYSSGVIPIAVDENFQPIIQEEIDVFEALISQNRHCTKLYKRGKCYKSIIER